MKHCNLLVIGSGPAGVHAAIQAAKIGKKVILVEKKEHKLGGAWLHTGTLPSKALRESVASIQNLKFSAGQEWVDRIIHEISFRELKEKADNLIASEESILHKHLSSNQIQVLAGTASFLDTHTIQVKNRDHQYTEIQCEKILIATGSRPRRPGNIPFDGWRVVDSDEILKIKDLPKKLIIYGAGVIGCEYACIFAAMGVETIVFDERKNIMQSIDKEISDNLKKSMENLGVTFKLSHKLLEVKTETTTCNLKFICDSKEESYSGSLFLFAAGRCPNTEELNLENIKVKLDERKNVAVNKDFQSSQPHIYAAGDVIGPPALAATSSEQGRYACCHAFNYLHREFPKVFPIGIYTIPELSSVGKSEEELIAENIPYVVGHGAFEEVARGQLRGDCTGMLKLLIDPHTEEILGIHIIGEDACNLIHIGLALMLKKAKASEFVDSMIFNYPTLAEAYRVAAFNALNKIRNKATSFNAA